MAQKPQYKIENRPFTCASSTSPIWGTSPRPTRKSTYWTPEANFTTSKTGAFFFWSGSVERNIYKKSCWLYRYTTKNYENWCLIMSYCFLQPILGLVVFKLSSLECLWDTDINIQELHCVLSTAYILLFYDYIIPDYTIRFYWCMIRMSSCIWFHFLWIGHVFAVANILETQTLNNVTVPIWKLEELIRIPNQTSFQVPYYKSSS